jgi:hypothetical protein
MQRRYDDMPALFSVVQHKPCTGRAADDLRQRFSLVASHCWAAHKTAASISYLPF